MLSKLTDYGDTITLVPQSGIQFVEYGFDFGTTPQFSRSFIERPVSQNVNADGHHEVKLIPNWDDDHPEGEPPHAIAASDDEYTISKKNILTAYLDRWLPVPFLRIEPGRDIYNNETFADGPVDWVRVKITETRKNHGDTEATHRVVFAFDTTLIEPRPGRPYLGISPSDAQQGEAFRFVHKLKDIAAFLSNKTYPQGEAAPPVDLQAWLTKWLEVTFYDSKRGADASRKLTQDDFPHRLEHVALYISMLGFLAQIITPAKVALIDTISENPRVAPINVDLVLDVGNARTCGLLIQNFANDSRVDLNRSLVLELRDLANPILSYREPFESHVELVHAEFGPEDLAKKSGRSRAFFWPSLVRLGPEAARYRAESEGTEAMTDLSSPKRYLWDVDLVPQSWRFRNMGDAAADFQPLVERSIYKYVNNRGDVLEQLEADRRQLKLRILPEDMESAEMLRFSRSSFFTFMMLEIIAQAQMMINNPGTRRRDREKDSPRRIRNIVLTIPSATPIQEQRIIRSRAEAAIKLFWSLMGWEKSTPGAPPVPKVHTSWDEASSVHLVYLYGEITQKLGGDIRTFLQLMGKKRPRTTPNGESAETLPEESIRIASVDVGGGTTDLMVTTYHQLDNRALVPVQNFREGFRRAGDDLLKLVIERTIIPAIEAHLNDCGLVNARNFLKERFSDDSPGMSEADKHLRRQFVLRLLKPAALSILGIAEEMALVGQAPQTVSFAQLLKSNPRALSEGSRILGYVQNAAKSSGAEGFVLGDTSVTVDQEVIDGCVAANFDKVFSNIAEAIYKLDVDVVLLTGRPSCLPGVVSLFMNQYAVPVDRVVAIRDYRVGNWYPFRQSAQSLIDDPKTTAVVGGMLCTLANGQLTNFTLFTDGLVMCSTARFIGEMRQDGVITDDKIYFADVDLDKDDEKATEAETGFYTTVRIGYRQLAREDWVAAPLYRLRLRPGEERKIKLPINVTIGRKSLAVDETASAVMLMNSEATSEEFEIKSAEDQNGTPLTRLMELKFDTSAAGSDGLYWLDSGILTIA